jgi:diacylglycerol kinase family enzyme
MRKIALLYNPVAGTRRRQRAADVDAAAKVFRKHDADVRVIGTESSGSAGQQAMQAIADGAEAIICCGGDGTIHDAVQPLVAAHVPTPVGVIPLGTGNGLAAELGISKHPANAAWELLRFEPRRIPVGKIEWNDASGTPQSRYFLISAGVGADAETIYRLAVDTKARHGVWAYYLYALRLYLTHRFTPVDVEYRVAAEPETRREIVAQVLAGRIERFGGIASRLTPGGSLENDSMQLVLFRTPRRWPMLRHAAAAITRTIYRTPRIEIVPATEVNCRPVPRGADLPGAWRHAKLASRVYAQADGELLGGLPVRMSMVPDALTLLMPPRVK